jgi:hypothetical protein
MKEAARKVMVDDPHVTKCIKEVDDSMSDGLLRSEGAWRSMVDKFLPAMEAIFSPTGSTVSSPRWNTWKKAFTDNMAMHNSMIRPFSAQPIVFNLGPVADTSAMWDYVPDPQSAHCRPRISGYERAKRINTIDSHK